MPEIFNVVNQLFNHNTDAKCYYTYIFQIKSTFWKLTTFKQVLNLLFLNVSVLK